MNPRLFALAFLVLLVGTASASVNLTSGLVSYWPFDEGSGTSAEDVHGSNNATLTSTTWTSSGVLDDAIYTGGSNSGKADTGLTISGSGTTQLTFSGWMKTSGSPSSFTVAPIISQGTNTNDRSFALYASTQVGVNRLYFIYSTTSASTNAMVHQYDAPSTTDFRNWHHIAVTRDGATTRLYINGTLVSTKTDGTTDNIRTPTGSLDTAYIGGYGDAFGNNQYIDEFGYWNRTLNSTEISALYANGSSLPYANFSSSEPEYVEVVLTTANGTGSWSVPGGVTSVDVLVVGGGGGSGYASSSALSLAGAGGAGGLVFVEDYNVVGYGGTISYTVGAGGAGGVVSGGQKGSSGSNSVFGDLTAVGGGGGGAGSNDGAIVDALSGGSGGGGGQYNSGAHIGDGGSATQTSTNDGYASTGFGFAGANAATDSAGGGGGAGGAASGTTGGACKTIWTEEYACGGNALDSSWSAAAASTGNGASSKASTTENTGIAGGSGVIIIRYVPADVLYVYADDEYDASSLSNISVNLTNATDTYSFSTTDGEVETSIAFATTGLFDISISSNDSGGYFTRLYEDVNVSTGVFTAELVQAYASFSCFELYTNDSLTCDEPGPHVRQADSYTDDVNVTGYYPVSYSYTLEALDNETFNVTGFYDHQLTINATDYEGNALINFTLTVESNLTSFNVTDNNTGTVVLPLLQGYLYNITITQNVPEGEDRNNSIETETFNITTSSESYQFNLTFPRLFINIYDEQTNLFVEDTTTITFSKGNESFSLNTTTGRLNLTGLEAIESGEYSVLFENSAYNPRTYDLTYNRTYAQTLNAYLVPLEAPSTIFTIEDSQSRSPVEGATVTIQRYVNGTLTTVLSLESDITGRVGFDYIPDRQYEFEITMTGYETRSFTLNPILFSSYTILLEPSISFGEIGGDFSGVSIIFSTNRYTESQTNNLTLSFSDPAGGLVSYGYNVSTATTGQLTSQSGSNAYGSILPSSFAIPDVPLYDQVRVDYYYERSDGIVRTFTTSYSITQVNAYQNQTWVNNRQIAENIAPLDRAAIVVIATGALSALAYTFVGLGGASLSAIVLLGFFAYSGFINGWIVAISIIGFMFLLLGRGSQ